MLNLFLNDVFPPFLGGEVAAEAVESNTDASFFVDNNGDGSQINDFRFICINNNINTVIEGKEPIPPTPPEPEPPIITLYVTNQGDNTVEIYDISSNPTAPVHVGEFNAANLVFPTGIAIQVTTQ